MSDWPAPQPLVVPTFVNTWSLQCPSMVVGSNLFGAQPAVIAWVANLAIFTPVKLPWDFPLARVFWNNGTTLGSNCDFGIYSESGEKLLSTGSTAQTTNNGPQFVDITDRVLPAATYYFAFTCDGTTARHRGTTSFTTLMLRQMGVYQQATIAPGSLPATMASVAAASQALYAMCGVTRTASGF